MFDEPAALQHHYTLRFALVADFQLSLFLVTDRRYKGIETNVLTVIHAFSAWEYSDFG